MNIKTASSEVYYNCKKCNNKYKGNVDDEILLCEDCYIVWQKNPNKLEEYARLLRINHTNSNDDL